ncbi:MAG: glycosyltransferase family 4 protein [Spirochaetia bacterium]|nr:glycosyltransferase family 4 protein [Spirochaetia bacterium]
MKKIAIVITRLDLGGAQKTALYLAQNLNPKRFEVHLIAGRGGILDKEVHGSRFGDGKKVNPRTENSKLYLNLRDEIVHPINPIFDLMAFFKLRDYFKKNSIDIVHTHSSKAGLLGRLAAKSAGVRTIIHTVHGFPFHEYQNPLMHFMYVALERFCARFSTKLVAVGNDVAEYGLKNGVGVKEQYEVIRAGVDLKEFADKSLEFGVKGRKRAKFLGDAGLDPKKFTVGMIGNLKKQKNPMEFVKIAAQTLKADNGIQFIFAGGGTGLDEIRQGLKNRKLDASVKFIGWTGEPAAFMGSLDLFLLTSRWEGLPCTLAQAVAAGKPVVASDIPGNREMVKQAKAGLLYTPGNIGAAVDAIIAIRSGNVKIKPLRAVLKDFDLPCMLKEYEKLYPGL